MTDSTSAPATVRFARLPRAGLLLGLSAARVACIAAAVAVLIPSLFMAGPTGLGLTTPLWAGALALAFVRYQGRPLIESMPTAAHFLVRRATGQNRFRVRPGRPRPAGTLALPGDAAALRFLIDEESGTVMVHDPHAQTLTAAALIRHPAYVLLSADEQARRVHGWSRALAHLASTVTGVRIQILEISQPDAGHGIQGWWQSHRVSPSDSWEACQYEELIRTVVTAAATHRTLAALSLDLRKASPQIRQSGRGLRGAAAFLRQEMTSFETSLRAADLKVAHWLSEGDLAATLRTAYEPGYDAADHNAPKLVTAGPVAVDEHWDHIRHDTGFSAVLWISEWPRVAAPPSFLHALIFQAGIRKTLSLTLQPVPPDQALRDIRKAKVDYATEAAQKARIGVIADLSDSIEQADVLDRESALIAGHADIRFTGLITVTAPTRPELEAAVAETARAAVQSGCETKRLNGQQARAFTSAALPLARRIFR